jgi:hypothetical protein
MARRAEGAGGSDTMSKGRLYELDEATRALPLVRAILTDVVREFRVLRHSGREQRSLEAAEDPCRDGAERLASLRAQVDESSRQIEGYLRELDALGVELRDLESGLVDFPTLVGGEPAYLCWKLGEEEIRWWHTASQGFADRQPIPEEMRAPLLAR